MQHLVSRKEINDYPKVGISASTYCWISAGIL
jgi:hypothetical protein